MLNKLECVLGPPQQGVVVFTYPTFDVEIVRAIDRRMLRWPERGAAQEDMGLGGNRSYIDLRGLSWREAHRVGTIERQLVNRLECATDPAEEYESIQDELFESDDNLYGLDLGVAAAVVSLAAAGCVPCASCNGGSFGDDHHECYPLVVFYARADVIDPVMASAEDAEIGLGNGERVIAYAEDVRKIMRFADCLRARSRLFRAARVRKRK